MQVSADLPWHETSHSGIIETMWDRRDRTPDFNKFRMRPYTPFFVYDPLLKQGGKHNGILLPSESKYLGKAYTITDHYVMYSTSDLGPSINRKRVCYVQDVRTSKSFDRAHVAGECYALTPRAILNLDRYMHNEDDFFRFEKSIFLPEQESPLISKKAPAIKAWMFLGNQAYWNKYKLEKLSWMKDHVREKWFWT